MATQHEKDSAPALPVLRFALDTGIARADSMSLGELAQHANEAAHASEGAFLFNLARAGFYLIAAKAKVAHGQWGGWLGANWRYSTQHADRAVQIAAACEGDPNNALRLGDGKSVRSALAAIGKPVTGKGPNSSRVRNPDPPQQPPVTESTVTDADFTVVGEPETPVPAARVTLGSLDDSPRGEVAQQQARGKAPAPPVERPKAWAPVLVDIVVRFRNEFKRAIPPSLVRSVDSAGNPLPDGRQRAFDEVSGSVCVSAQVLIDQIESEFAEVEAPFLDAQKGKAS